MKSKQRNGISLLETVVVLAVIGLLVSLLVPRILDSRERVRVAECANNLRWMGEAWLQHESAQNHLPSSGWGWRWTGEPDRGFGKDQPGGWAYNMIRFTEYDSVVSQGAGERGTAKSEGMKRAHSTPIPQFYCPARREIRTYPLSRNGFLAHNLQNCQQGSCPVVRIDYQANSGNIALGETGGPAPGNMNAPDPGSFRGSNGVTTMVSETRLGQIVDGLSKTMMVAEKYLNPTDYASGTSAADDSSAYVGLNRDVNGYTATASYRLVSTSFNSRNESFDPRRDRAGLSLNWTFGSPHAVGFNSLNCDGSVRFLQYGIDYRTFFLMGGRNDGSVLLPGGA